MHDLWISSTVAKREQILGLYHSNIMTRTESSNSIVVYFITIPHWLSSQIGIVLQTITLVWKRIGFKYFALIAPNKLNTCIKIQRLVRLISCSVQHIKHCNKQNLTFISLLVLINAIRFNAAYQTCYKINKPKENI